MNVVDYRVAHQDPGIYHQNDGRLMAGIDGAAGHQKRKRRFGRVLTTVRSNEKLTDHVALLCALNGISIEISSAGVNEPPMVAWPHT